MKNKVLVAGVSPRLPGPRSTSTNTIPTLIPSVARNSVKLPVQLRPRRRSHWLTAVLATTSSATPSAMPRFDERTSGSTWAKITEISESSTTFSARITEKNRSCPLMLSSRRGRCASTSTVKGQSAGGMSPRRTQIATPSDTAAAPSTAHMYGRSDMNWVKSSLAMWIHHSWGSFTNTQIAPASSSTVRAVMRNGFQRVRTASYAMKKYSNVFANTNTIQRCSSNSKSVTPTRRYRYRKRATSNATGSRQLRIAEM